MTDTDNLEDILKIKFHDSKLLLEALTHRSFLNENRQIKQSNERLEFLGDSVLSVLTSTELFHRFPAYPEGQLTNLRSALVRAKTLSLIAKELRLGEFLQMSKGEEKSGGRENESLLADTFEAVLGAIYLDQGLTKAEAFLASHIFPLITVIEKQENIYDYKSKLQETTQQQSKISPTYKVAGESGPDHNKTFSIGVFLGDKLMATGQGRSKQEAEQEAARLALQVLKR